MLAYNTYGSYAWEKHEETCSNIFTRCSLGCINLVSKGCWGSFILFLFLFFKPGGSEPPPPRKKFVLHFDPPLWRRVETVPLRLGNGTFIVVRFFFLLTELTRIPEYVGHTRLEVTGWSDLSKKLSYHFGSRLERKGWGGETLVRSGTSSPLSAVWFDCAI